MSKLIGVPPPPKIFSSFGSGSISPLTPPCLLSLSITYHLRTRRFPDCQSVTLKIHGTGRGLVAEVGGWWEGNGDYSSSRAPLNSCEVKHCSGGNSVDIENNTLQFTVSLITVNFFFFASLLSPVIKLFQTFRPIWNKQLIKVTEFVIN